MRSTKLWLYGLILIAAVLSILLVMRALDTMLPGVQLPPAIGELTVERVDIVPEGFVAKIRANSQEPMQIAQVMVDSAYWVFAQSPPGPLSRGAGAMVTINFPWVAGDAHHLKFVTSVGETFEHTIDIALETPSLSIRSLRNHALLGILVGLLPVALGMLSFPILNTLGTHGLEFILAVTVGLLAYLFIDMTFDGLEIAARASSMFGGQLLVFVPLLLTLAALQSLSQRSSSSDNGTRIAILIALGIGLHNLGEGLAIGASFAVNKAAMGAFLVVGFTLHNITEGVGIVAPLVNKKPRRRFLCLLALIAGLPVVPGLWLGAYSFAPHWAAIYFGVGAGAIAQVVVEIDRFFRTRPDSQFANTRFSHTSVAGYCAGVSLMYATALLISV
jgi:ZIP family zinc transporter